LIKKVLNDMERALKNLKPHELKILFGIIEKLSGGQDHAVFRKEISKDLLQLLGADFFASFIWNPSTNSFGDPVLLNMCPANVARYETHFQFHDPITHLLQKRRRATLVCEVLAQKELEKTDFFNDFLMKDGLHHGMNLYAYDGDLNIGDLRIWRSSTRPDFDRRDVAILDFILPYFRNALRNARHLAAARSTAGLWDGFFENTQIALFLFDHNNRFVFQNKSADSFMAELADPLSARFYEALSALLKRSPSQTEWGPFSLSVFHSFSPEDGRPVKGILASRSSPPRIDREDLKIRFELTPRETDICLLICKGLTDQEIASVLNIAFSTIRTHLKHIFLKLDVSNRSELISILFESVVEISY